MTFCRECGLKLGFFEHATDGICNGCQQRLAREHAEEAHMQALAPYTGAELPTVTARGAIMKKGEIARYITPATLKEIKTVSLGYSGGSHGVSIPIPGLKIGGPRFGTVSGSHAGTS